MIFSVAYFYEEVPGNYTSLLTSKAFFKIETLTSELTPATEDTDPIGKPIRISHDGAGQFFKHRADLTELLVMNGIIEHCQTALHLHPGLILPARQNKQNYSENAVFNSEWAALDARPQRERSGMHRMVLKKLSTALSRLVIHDGQLYERVPAPRLFLAVESNTAFVCAFTGNEARYKYFLNQPESHHFTTCMDIEALERHARDLGYTVEHHNVDVAILDERLLAKSDSIMKPLGLNLKDSVKVAP